MRSKITKKKISFFIIIILISINFFSIKIANAEMKIPDLELGDTWQYKGWIKNFQGYGNVSDEYFLTINAKKNISIEGKNYEVWEIEIIYIENPINSNNKKYYKTSDLSLVKTDWYEHDSWAYFEETYSIYPIKTEGKKEVTTKRIAHENEEISTNYNTKIIEYLGKRNISTEAGNFNCYTIKSYKKGEQENFGLSYYSPKVGWLVKFKGYTNNEIVNSVELTAYKTHNASAGEINFNKEGFNEVNDYTFIIIFLLAILILIIIFIFYQYKKLRK